MRNKQTKVVATVSDQRCGPDFIKQLHDNGMDVVRLNTAHQTPETCLQVIKNIREASDKIAILIDTKGPEVRTTAVNAPIELKRGQDIIIRASESTTTADAIHVNYSGFVKDVPDSSSILMDDGDLELKVIRKANDALHCRVMNKGTLKSHKSVNVPGIHLDLPSLTRRDKEFLQLAMEQDIDFIAHSFVRNADDVKAIQQFCKKKPIRIIAKIENTQGVENLDEILDYSYGVMVARGDLGVEIPAEEVPLIQKTIIRRCIQRAKPVITATQMLQSMIENPRPTRAEVSDVANAILDGTDALMLSAETAAGKYPVAAVRIMAKVAKRIECSRNLEHFDPIHAEYNPVSEYIAMAAVEAAQDLLAQAIIIPTQSGLSARMVSAYRGRIPVYAQCMDEAVMRSLALSHGIRPSKIPPASTTEEMVRSALARLVEEGNLKAHDRVVVMAGTPGKPEGSNFIEIDTVKHILEDYRKK
ncbi:pyruvate kinase [Candidatus Woesearchaeota archaeon CG1_02_57_44]|nr:MAG: pyruvate kinase [Candidatus Woesearchaeota archaeon CG1_02_57_44]